MKMLANGSKEKLQEDELITYDNVMQISERIALKGLKKALSYSFNRKLYALYLGLNTDIANKDKADYVMSDGYDLVMTAAQFLSEHIGERLCTNTYPAIIDKALFERVQKRLAANRYFAGGAATARVPYLLTGKAFCARCEPLWLQTAARARRAKRTYTMLASARKKANATSTARKKTDWNFTLLNRYITF